MNLTQLFDLSFTGRADRPAIEYYDREGNPQLLTFAEVEGRSRRMASVLSNRGVRRGDRLCVYLANSMEMIDIYLACIRSGIIFVPINILYKEREVAHILRDAEPAGVIVDGELPAQAASWQLRDIAAEAAEMSPDFDAVPVDGDSPAAIVYTSGTTGTSKGAVLTHNNFASNAVGLNTCWRITSADRLLLALPLFHVHGLGNGLHCWLISGCRMRLLERFDHKTAEATLLDFRPTLLFGVPTMYVRLLELPENSAQEIGQFMRLFVCGSAPLPAQVLEEFRSRFGAHNS